MADFISPPHNTASPFVDMRGRHSAMRTPDLESAKRWCVDALDFLVIVEWDYVDEELAYLAPATDDHFHVELLGGRNSGPQDVRPYSDLGDSLKSADDHHFCLNGRLVARGPGWRLDHRADLSHQRRRHLTRRAT